MRGDETCDRALGRFGFPETAAEKNKARRGELARCAIGELDDGHIGIFEAAENIGENGDGVRDVIGKSLSIGRIFPRCVNGDLNAFGLFWIELKIAGDERAVRAGSIALEGVEKAATACRGASCHRSRGGSFAGAGDREVIRDVEMKGSGIAVGGIVGERKPARGEKKEGAVVADHSGADAGDGTIFRVGEEARVRECECDVATNGNGSWKSDQHVERVHRVAAEADGLAVGGGHSADDEIGMELDAKIARDGGRGEFYFSDGTDGLAIGIERRRDVVMVSEKAGLLRNLSAKRRG